MPAPFTKEQAEALADAIATACWESVEHNLTYSALMALVLENLGYPLDP